ncbi:Lipoprotein 28 [Aquicella lusitana]|uniref:D-methionine transport system substrate-binding protein n=2 Tax=Aquicella lusitana TaxID=254246 RepID=A0A370GSB0_9COXI|nr:D-methionine transport system substrate-binding protein [Aquicella lusitana]VVC73020.1 Lipoprotein 28 [Aquicella lusitana]
MHEIAFLPLIKATWETIYMVFIASFISILVGLMLGVFLYLTAKKQTLENTFIHRLLGTIVNVTRSVPFIILMISIIPLTRFLVGTTIGTNAAIVPLTLAAIPFFARVAENALAQVPYGLIEAAHAMGASTWQTVTKVLIPESLPALIRGATLTVIGLIGYSAMAGVVGGGGLGELAINYGYQQFNIAVMLETVIILIALVQLIQMLGDTLAKRRRVKALFYASVLLWAACFTYEFWPSAASHTNTLRIGIMSGSPEKIMAVAQQVAQKEYGLHLQIVTFSDYVQPNTALNNGSIDANIFQHGPYLEAQIKAHHYPLTAIAKTFVYPMGFYSQTITHLSQLKEGAVIAIPNDPSNGGRALLILQKAGLIKLKAGSGTLATVRDITDNPRHLQFKVMDAAQLPRVLKDADLVAITNDFVGPAGLSIGQAVLKEGSDSPYANLIVVRDQDKTKPLIQTLVTVMHSKAVLHETEKVFPDGAAIPAWK